MEGRPGSTLLTIYTVNVSLNLLHWNLWSFTRETELGKRNHQHFLGLLDTD